MYTVFQAEWIRLRQPRLLLSASAAIVGFSVLVTAVTLLLAFEGGVRQTTSRSLHVHDILASNGLALLYGQTVMIFGLIAASIAAAQIASDYTQGTLRSLLIREPQRLKLLLGKYVAMSCLVVLLIMLGVFGVTSTAIIITSMYQMPIDHWTSTSGWHSSLLAALNLALSSLGWATLGMALGIFFRSAITAITVGATYGLIEGVVGTFLGASFFRWLPGRLLSAVASGGTKEVPYTSALLLSFLYLLIIAGGALLLFLRRDVTE